MKVTWSRLGRVVLIFSLSINSAFALPIDWNGVFGVDTHLLNNVCRTKDTVTKTAGTQGITGDCGANFQTYTFRLLPQIIVNDGVTLKGELSSGFIRGGLAGDEGNNGQNDSGNNSYFFVTPAQRSALNVNQMYMELYADAALVKLGRFSRHYGLGVVFDNGSEAWDRFFTVYDGVEAEMKISNFSLVPYYAKISSFDDANGSAKPAGGWDVRETGVVAKYDNKNRDLVVSLLYAKRFSEAKNSLYNTNTGPATTPATQDRGKTEVTIIDPFVSKRWNKFKVAVEAPMLAGDYGNVYNSGQVSKISANAYIVEANYDMNPKWDLGFNGGQVSGDKGSSGKFEAAYLHPNYHIAELMFRYRYHAFNEGNENIFNSSINNTQYLKLFANFKSDKWTWKAGVITAKALQTAKAGEDAYHHEENYRFASTQDQSDSLGTEVDLGFDYRWNPNVLISGYYGYWMVGDYYSFSNSPEELDLTDVHGGGVRATLEF